MMPYLSHKSYHIEVGVGLLEYLSSDIFHFCT